MAWPEAAFKVDTDIVKAGFLASIETTSDGLQPLLQPARTCLQASPQGLSLHRSIKMELRTISVLSLQVAAAATALSARANFVHRFGDEHADHHLGKKLELLDLALPAQVELALASRPRTKDSIPFDQSLGSKNPNPSNCGWKP